MESREMALDVGLRQQGVGVGIGEVRFNFQQGKMDEKYQSEREREKCDEIKNTTFTNR